jgi:hypothetical protein
MLTFLVNLYCPKISHRPEHYIRINEYHRKIIIISKPNIFTETRTQGSFWVCDLSFCNLLAETNNLVLFAVLLLPLVSELQKPSSPELEPRTAFGVVFFVSVISCSKQTSLVFPGVVSQGSHLLLSSSPHFLYSLVGYFT